MPVRPARVGRVGVIGAPVAKTAVVAETVSTRPRARSEDRGRGRGRGTGAPSADLASIRWSGSAALRLLPDVVGQLDPHPSGGPGGL